MLITKDFVMLNFPKTGTTFTRAVLKQLYGDRIEEILGRNPMNPHSVPDSPHLAVSQIPQRYAKLPIVSIYRNLFDRYVSLWQFRWYLHAHPSIQDAALDSGAAVAEGPPSRFVSVYYNQVRRPNPWGKRSTTV